MIVKIQFYTAEWYDPSFFLPEQDDFSSLDYASLSGSPTQTH